MMGMGMEVEEFPSGAVEGGEHCGCERGEKGVSETRRGVHDFHDLDARTRDTINLDHRSLTDQEAVWRK